MSFNLRSGNTTPFKQMGSSPAKQGLKKEFKQLKSMGPEQKPMLDKNKNKISDTVESIESKQGHIEKPPKKKKVSLDRPGATRVPESPVSPVLPKAEDIKVKKEPITKPVPKINMPKGFAPNISDEQRAKSKGTLKGVTGFEADFPIASKFIKLTNPMSTAKKKVAKKIVKKVKKEGKKAYDYFTKK